eukprot:NODE_3228_length_924_cov_50.619824_g3207_i0.p1 GENE.NODE_3228_length_924_cov_50.619824_g3207_i0~~NODE_3228_length_924_cov_50.619824_g3207_i0.p1  ORF type:complete len:219 (+),score=40.56 NODE_3228_length_924_cov_50.619824_g3207_i0:157-813(+)
MPRPAPLAPATNPTKESEDQMAVDPVKDEPGDEVMSPVSPTSPTSPMSPTSPLTPETRTVAPKVNETCWIFTADSGDARAFGFHLYTLVKELPDGNWDCTLAGQHAAANRVTRSNVPCADLLMLPKKSSWRPTLGDLVLAWRVPANEAAGGWYVGRIVRMEWQGLYDGEDDTVYNVQMLTASGFASDQSDWEKARVSALMPLPAKYSDVVARFAPQEE